MNALRNYFSFTLLLFLAFNFSCKKEEEIIPTEEISLIIETPPHTTEWNRIEEPVFIEDGQF